jgi:uncharacterized protein (TIGR02145 family)
MKFILFIFCICSTASYSQSSDAFIDEKDGKIYKTTLIGSQIWMSENLNSSKFRNGDKINEAKTIEEWNSACQNKQPVWCYYDNDPSNGTNFGKLYNWYAVTDSRGLAPKGWHVPNNKEWIILENHLGGASYAGKKLKSQSGFKWDGNGSNSSGFTALPGGQRFSSGTFLSKNANAYWWCSDTPIVYHRFVSYFGDNCFTGVIASDVSTNDKNKCEGFSVRCIKD